MPPPDDAQRYTIDDLVGHEKRQMRFVLAFLVLAVLVLTGRKMLTEQSGSGPSADVAPVLSGG